MRITRAGLVTAAFLATFVVVRPGTSSTPSSAAMVALPMTAGGLTTARPTIAKAETAATLGADEYVYRVYRGGGAAIEMDVAYYSDPRVGRVMHSPLNCLPGNGWQISGVQTVPVGGGMETRALVAERGKTRLALMYWYQTPRHVTGNEFTSRLHLLTDAVRAGRRDTSLVRLVSPIAKAPEESTAALARFASQLIPQIAQQFH